MNLIQGSNRERIAAADVTALRKANALIEDDRRQRPRWFDGRFLAARDLVREQNYFLTREADLGQDAGSGVANGLAVAAGSEPHSLVIGAGHGVTPAGELVLLGNDVTIRLADIPRAEQYTAKFGLGRLPQPPMRSRNGLFVLALRPVEFTANPIGAYPTSITGQRTVEDGDVIEAAAIVLIPWPDDGSSDNLDVRRGQVARAIFVDGQDRGLSANVLPLAMIALANNTLAWIDAPMVRRELGADRGDLPGLGFAPHALRLAHLLQHQGHIADVIQAAGGRGFPAASWFPALPPAGPLPPGVISPTDFTQSYFPAEIAVEFSIIPEDELPALVEEALALPGIDLTAAAETLQSTSVLVLAPIPRSDWRATVATLTTLSRAVIPAAPNLVAVRKPLEILQRLRLPRPIVLPLDPASPSDAKWQQLAQLSSLWYVRRRNVAYREDLAGAAQRIAGLSPIILSDLTARLNSLGLGTAFNNVMTKATPAAQAEVVNLLASPKLQDSATMTAAALGQFTQTDTLDHAAALKAAAAVTASNVGTGLARIESTTNIASTPAALQALATTANWKALDSAAAVAPATSVTTLASSLSSDIVTVRPTVAAGTVISRAPATTVTKPPAVTRSAATKTTVPKKTGAKAKTAASKGKTK
jgi:hypothetical protein